MTLASCSIDLAGRGSKGQGLALSLFLLPPRAREQVARTLPPQQRGNARVSAFRRYQDSGRSRFAGRVLSGFASLRSLRDGLRPPSAP
jgi:hypothetical protein